MSMTSYQGSVERHYFLVLKLLREFGFEVVKTKDTYSTSITSAYWGSIEQRRTIQQEKAAQYLGVIGNMIKSMFQIIRSLRIMDERKKLYDQAKNGPDKKSAEIALKGIWIDMVEGAGKNPSSVYGLATQVGFSTLPDLFFDICPKDAKDLERKLKDLQKNGFNRKITEVLGRKLTQYRVWRDDTGKEINTNRKFHLAYLRQHFNVIRLYINWIKPYLTNVSKLTQKTKRKTEMLEFADTATADIELFAYQTKSGDNKLKKWFPTITVTFEFTTVPELAFRQEYQQGPIHVGKTRIIFEGKGMLIDEMHEKFRQQMIEDIGIIQDLNTAMSALGDDLVDYLEAAHEDDPSGKLGKKLEKGAVKPPKAFTKLFGPFKDISKGFSNLFGALTFRKKGEEPKEKKSFTIYDDIPENIEKAVKARESAQKIQPGWGKKRLLYKKRSAFANDKNFQAYVKQLQKDNNVSEEKEKANAKKVSDKQGGDLGWKIYDTYKKNHKLVRW
jgi:hypothetical protein